MDISICALSTCPPQPIFISVLLALCLSVCPAGPHWRVHPETAFHRETFTRAFMGVLRDRELPSQARFRDTRLPVTQVSSVWGSGAWGGSRRRVSLPKAEAMGQVSQTCQSTRCFSTKHLYKQQFCWGPLGTSEGRAHSSPSIGTQRAVWGWMTETVLVSRQMGVARPGSCFLRGRVGALVSLCHLVLLPYFSH